MKIYCTKFIIFVSYLFFVILFNSQIFSQDHGRGLLLDPELYVNSPQSAPLMRGNYDGLPEQYSLKQFCPTPQSQGVYGTCTGWASAFAGRTILAAIKNGWDQKQIDENVYSPSFVYNQIKHQSDCYAGASLVEALDVLRDIGAAELSEFEYDCDKIVTEEDIANAADDIILEYRELFYRAVVDKVSKVKKSISEHKPVVVGMKCPESFFYPKGVWEPYKEDYTTNASGHAITIIGYDDNKYGGAFEFINSWGTDWGNSGFIWMKYADFDKFCYYGFEMIEKTAVDPAKPDLSGSLTFTTSAGELMDCDFNGDYFEMIKSYPSGTLFELRISNNEPAYVYAFGSDLTYKTTKLFPFNKNMVAYLPYRKNDVALPDEDSYNMLDETTGTTYYGFLYSNEKLDIDEILKQIEAGEGTMWERIKSTLSDKLVLPQNIDYGYRFKIEFSAKSMGRSIVPVLVEIIHE